MNAAQENALAAGTAQGAEGLLSVHHDSARGEQPSQGELCEREKPLRTLRAELALRGFVLEVTDGPTFIVSRWNLERRFNCLNELKRFSGRVGVEV